jgi:hypothetical protein
MAEEPYRRGALVAWFQLDGDVVRVREAQVLAVIPNAHGWEILTNIGKDVVNDQGEGTLIVEMDSFLAHELHVRGNGYKVLESDVLPEWENFESTPDKPRIGGDQCGNDG